MSIQRSHKCGTASAIALVIVLCFGCDTRNQESDLRSRLSWNPILTTFNTNRTDFENLIKMIQTDDKLTRVAEDWTRPDDPSTIGISQHRIDTYRKIFSKCGIRHGFEGIQKKNVVYFIFEARGLSINGYTRGIAYINNSKQHNIITSFESLADPPLEGEYFQILEGNWYLYLDVRR